MVYAPGHHVLFRQPTANSGKCVHLYSRLYWEPENYHADGDNDTLVSVSDSYRRQCALHRNNHRCGASLQAASNGKRRKSITGKGELTLAFAAQVGDRSLALRIEYRIKQLTKRQKERLVTEREAFEALLSSLQTPVLKND